MRIRAILIVFVILFVILMRTFRGDQSKEKK
jgi:hypothetical protein